ncbi:MAG TPA: RluA family pseudouridine synthase [Thermoanaerobaculia bacterium]|nr:RluA family pseudouridine synthase [Thermoanaerobaculia bacterium]
MILFESDRFLAVEKPSGLSMATRAGDDSAVPRILVGLGLDPAADLRLVHRLDVGTSGIVLVARGAAAHRAATSLFAARRVRKVYRAVVWGHPVPARGIVDRPLAVDREDRRRMRVVAEGKRAVTRWTTLERLTSVAHLELEPETGRTHQIRVHLASLGHPLVGDDLYGGPRWRGVRDPELRRVLAGPLPLLLHAAALSFLDPETGAAVEVRSEEPGAFRAVLGAAARARGAGGSGHPRVPRAAHRRVPRAAHRRLP